MDEELELALRPFVWTKTAGDILESLAKYCKVTNDVGHDKSRWLEKPAVF
jgi:hypothetical protein